MQQWIVRAVVTSPATTWMRQGGLPPRRCGPRLRLAGRPVREAGFLVLAARDEGEVLLATPSGTGRSLLDNDRTATAPWVNIPPSSLLHIFWPAGVRRLAETQSLQSSSGVDSATCRAF